MQAPLSTIAPKLFGQSRLPGTHGTPFTVSTIATGCKCPSSCGSRDSSASAVRRLCGLRYQAGWRKVFINSHLSHWAYGRKTPNEAMQRKVEELQQLKGEMTEQLKVERRYFFQSREAGRTELKRLREEEADRKRKLGASGEGLTASPSKK